MIQHFTPDGRRVYTLSEAAEILHGDDEPAARRWIEKTRRRLNRQRTPKAGEINAREPVYYPKDLGITNYQEDPMITIADLSDDTQTVIASLVDATIDREYGAADADARITGGRMLAQAGLSFDLRPAFIAYTGSDQGLDLYLDGVLRQLVAQGLQARLCQCVQLHPRGCPHGSAVGSLWCAGHHEADVPELGGALLCGTCHVAEAGAAR